MRNDVKKFVSEVEYRIILSIASLVLLIISVFIGMLFVKQEDIKYRYEELENEKNEYFDNVKYADSLYNLTKIKVDSINIILSNNIKK